MQQMSKGHGLLESKPDDVLLKQASVCSKLTGKWFKLHFTQASGTQSDLNHLHGKPFRERKKASSS